MLYKCSVCCTRPLIPKFSSSKIRHILKIIGEDLTANIFESGPVATPWNFLALAFHGVGFGPLSKILAVKYNYAIGF